MAAIDDSAVASSRSGFRFVSGVSLAAISVIAVALLAVVGSDSFRLVGRTFPGFFVWNNGVLVALHRSTWTGEMAQLPLDDGVLIAVDGAPFSGGRQFLDDIAELEPGTPVRLRVENDGMVRDFVVPTMRFSLADYAITLGTYILNAVAFLAIALIALYLRPDRREARALAAACGSVGAYFLLTVDHVASYRLYLPLFLGAEALTTATVAHFGLVFPTERLRPNLRGMLVGLVAVGALAIEAVHFSVFAEQPQLTDQLNLLVYGILFAILVGVLASFTEALLRADDPQKRMRAAIVFSGGLLAFLPPGIAILAFAQLGWAFSWSLLSVFYFTFPACLLYAVLRHDLLGAERFVRLAVGYAMATALLVLTYAFGVLGLDRFVSTEASRDPATGFILLLVLAVSFDPLRRRVQLGIDRAFFRSQVDVAEVLEESGAELASLSSAREIARRVGERLREALLLEWAELRLDGQDDSAEEPAVAEVVAFRGEILGHLACGPKRAGAPFSSMERDLVKGLASQAALALHNARSIQELREAQQSLLRSARLAAIGEFAGEVAHGIRNPLAGIRASAQVAAELARGTPVAETLEGVLSEADRLEQRIRTLLDFSRPYEPTVRPSDLCEIVEAVRRAVDAQARQQGIEIALKIPTEPLVWELDPDYIEEALLELVGNSLRAMPEGGQLTLEIERDGGEVILRVADNGPGIVEAVRHRIFDLFFTTREDGTGMGLAKVKKIIDRHGGTVHLEEPDSGGTSFRLQLPAIPA